MNEKRQDVFLGAIIGFVIGLLVALVVGILGLFVIPKYMSTVDVIIGMGLGVLGGIVGGVISALKEFRIDIDPTFRSIIGGLAGAVAWAQFWMFITLFGFRRIIPFIGW